MKVLLLLIRKDLTLELRSKANICLFVALAIMLSVVTSFGVRSALLSPDSIARLFPGLLWLIFTFVATLVMGKVYDSEFEEGALHIVLVSEVSDALVYTAKVLTYSLIVFLCQTLAMIVLAVFLNMNLWADFGALLVVSFLVVFAYVSLAQLFSVLAYRSQRAGLLLPVILIPLLLPLFFAAVELTSLIFLFDGFPLGSSWFTLLVGLDAIYFALGINLYKFAVVPS